MESERLDERTIRWCPHCSSEGLHHGQCKHEDVSFIRTPKPGAKIADKYEFVSLLGVGGMGAVYKCRYVDLDIFVAVKTIVGQQYGDQEILRLQTEAKAAGKFKHDNLVRVLDFGITNDGAPFMVMEYLEGKTLEKVVSSLDVKTIDLVRIFKDCAKGLCYAHKHSVLHRDLKPSNIMLANNDDESSCVKILDFGIAKISDASQELTRTGQVFGTPAYMSPEQAAGGTVTARSDVYSLGCVMFEAFTGERPLVGQNMLETFQLRQSVEAPLLSDVRSDRDFPERLEELIELTLESDPQKRPTMETVFSELNKIEEELMETAHAANESEKESETRTTENDSIARSSLLHSRIAMVSVGILLGCAVVVFLIAQWARLNPGPEKTSVVSPHESIMEGSDRMVDVPDDEVAISQLALRKVQHQLDDDGVRLTNNALDDAQVDLLSKHWAKAENLSISNYSGVTAERLKCLSSNGRIQRLFLENTDLDDAGLKVIADDFRRLRALTIRKSENVTDRGFASFHPDSSLESIKVNQTEVGDVAMNAFSKMKKLSWLDLNGNPMPALSSGKRNPHGGIDDESMRILSAQKNLDYLSLASDSVTDKGLKYVSNIRALSDLRLDNLPITDDGVKTLSRLDNLETLSLSDCHGVTDGAMAALAEIARKGKLNTLILDRTAITAKSVDMLRTMKSLQTLTLVGVNGIKAREKARIKEGIPHIRFVTVDYAGFSTPSKILE